MWLNKTFDLNDMLINYEKEKNQKEKKQTTFYTHTVSNVEMRKMSQANI